MEQLFQFLQDTAQEEGFFGESQSSCPGFQEAGEGLLVAAAPCWAVAAQLQEGGLQSTERAFRSRLSPNLGWLLPSTRREACTQWLSALPTAFTSFFPPECADPNLAISAIWTFRDLGVRGAGLTILLSPTPSPTP